MRSIWSANTSTIGEAINGTVTRIIVRMFVAPPTLAASSRPASMFRNAGVSNITFRDMPLPIRLAHTMPGTEKMLNGP